MNASGDGNNNYPDRMMHPENEQRRKGKGRQKIEMAKIENDTNLQVTFSKRRAGVFKKASELGVLCGAEYAIVVYSPGEKPHSFGNPSVEAITTRFLQANGGGGGAPPGRGTIADRRVMAHQEAAENQRNQEVVTAEARVEQAKQRRRELDSMPPVLQMENLSYEQLEQLRNSVLMYKQGVQAKFSGGGAGVYGYGGVNVPVYGQNVQYPPMGYNYGGPYNAATGSLNANVGGAHVGANYGGFPSSSGNINSGQGGANYGGFPGSSDGSFDGAQGGANYGGFPGNYYHHHPGY